MAGLARGVLQVGLRGLDDVVVQLRPQLQRRARRRRVLHLREEVPERRRRQHRHRHRHRRHALNIYARSHRPRLRDSRMLPFLIDLMQCQHTRTSMNAVLVIYFR